MSRTKPREAMEAFILPLPGRVTLLLLLILQGAALDVRSNEDRDGVGSWVASGAADGTDWPTYSTASGGRDNGIACRVAVCFSGHVRSFVYPVVHRSIRRNLIQSIEDEGCDVDIFAYATLVDIVPRSKQVHAGKALTSTVMVSRSCKTYLYAVAKPLLFWHCVVDVTGVFGYGRCLKLLPRRHVRYHPHGAYYVHSDTQSRHHIMRTPRGCQEHRS